MMRRIAPIVFAMLVAGCGGGGSSGTATVPVPSPPSNVKGYASVRIEIVVPKSTLARHAARMASRIPHWVSPNTLSIVVWVNGTPNNTATAYANVTCGTSCSGGVTLQAPIGQTDSFYIQGYDKAQTASVLQPGASPVGNLVEQGAVSQAIGPGLTTIPVTMGGTVNSFAQVNLCPSSTPACGASYQIGTTGSSNWVVSVSQPLDADGNVIVGTYDNPLQVSHYEPSQSGLQFTLSKTTLTNSGDQVQVTYDGSFDGLNAPTSAISVVPCQPGTPVGSASCTLNSSNEGYAFLEIPCAPGTAACASEAFWGGGIGSYFFAGGHFTQVASTVYALDQTYFLDSLTTAGITQEIPSNEFLLAVTAGLTGNAIVPPTTWNSNDSMYSDGVTVGSTAYFEEDSGNMAAFTPPSTYVEYRSATLTNGTNDFHHNIVAGGDGNIYGAEAAFASSQELFQFNPSSHAVTEISLQSARASLVAGSMGSTIYYGANDLGNNFDYIGFMADGFTGLVPKSNETSLGKFATGDPWQLTDMVPVASAKAIFFTAIDYNGTTNEIGEYNATTKAVTYFPLPATWPNGAASSLGSIEYNAVDGYVYFVDISNHVLGRFLPSSPSTITGAGLQFNVEPCENGHLFVASTGDLYCDTSINSTTHGGLASGTVRITPSLLTWSSTPSAGAGIAIQLRPGHHTLAPHRDRRPHVIPAALHSSG